MSKDIANLIVEALDRDDRNNRNTLNCCQVCIFERDKAVVLVKHKKRGWEFPGS